jgi:hypothetical protein
LSRVGITHAHIIQTSFNIRTRSASVFSFASASAISLAERVGAGDGGVSSLGSLGAPETVEASESHDVSDTSGTIVSSNTTASDTRGSSSHHAITQPAHDHAHAAVTAAAGDSKAPTSTKSQTVGISSMGVSERISVSTPSSKNSMKSFSLLPIKAAYASFMIWYHMASYIGLFFLSSAIKKLVSYSISF